MKSRDWIGAIGGLWGLAALSQPPAAYAVDEIGKDAVSPIQVICLTERPVIEEGQVAGLQAWVSTPDGQPIVQLTAFEWQVTAGKIQGTGADVRWDLSTVPIDPGEMHEKVAATVKVAAPSVGDGRCLVEVFIGKKESPIADPSLSETRGGLIAARRYLSPGETEEAGYGLYSYVLFSTPPQNEDAKARYLKTLESCLVSMQTVDEYLKRHKRPSELNATHIPVTRAPKGGKSPTKLAEEVLTVYDYATAQVLLNKLAKTYQRGPYLISVRTPLTQAPNPAPLHLLQNLTGVAPELAWKWVDFFTYLAAQERSWTDESLRRFGLRMRNLIAVGGKVTPDVAGNLTTMIQLVAGK